MSLKTAEVENGQLICNLRNAKETSRCQICFHFKRRPTAYGRDADTAVDAPTAGFSYLHAKCQIGGKSERFGSYKHGILTSFPGRPAEPGGPRIPGGPCSNVA